MIHWMIRSHKTGKDFDLDSGQPYPAWVLYQMAEGDSAIPENQGYANDDDARAVLNGYHFSYYDGSGPRFKDIAGIYYIEVEDEE